MNNLKEKVYSNGDCVVCGKEIKLITPPEPGICSENCRSIKNKKWPNETEAEQKKARSTRNF